MNCTEYTVLLEKYLDGSLTPAEDRQLRQHEESCAACAAQRLALDGLQDHLASLKDNVPDIPEDFHQRWTTLVEEDAMENREKKTASRRQWTRILSTAAALVFVLGGTLLTRDSLAPRHEQATQTSYDYASEDSYDTAAANGVMMLSSAPDAGSGVVYSRRAKAAGDSVPMQQEKKIIRTVTLTMGTHTFDESLSALRALCEEKGGWVSYSSENTASGGKRVAYLTLRIPSDQLDTWLDGSGSLGRMISREESAADVSDSYYDTQSRLATQQALMARLQALMTDAASLSDLLALESQIADTQYTIDSLQASLNSTDQQVNYATVSVTLREETSASDITDSEKTLWQRILSALETGVTAFADFAADVLVFLTAALPFILTLGAVWLIIRLVRRRRKK